MLEIESASFYDDPEDDIGNDDDIYHLIENRLERLARWNDNILSVAINFRYPSQGHFPALYEVSVVVHMAQDNFAITKQGEKFVVTLDETIEALQDLIRERYNPNNDL
jgi:ribosome-associated translation inhibitor RaiA